MIALTNMKPITLSDCDVRAVLEGKKKAHVVPVNPQPPEGANFLSLSDDMPIIRTDRRGMERDQHTEGLYATFEHEGWPEFPVFKAPYQPGDVLYARESWYLWYGNEYLYGADDQDVNVGKLRRRASEDPLNKWRSPVTMPKDAARLFFKVMDVKVMRLRDLSVQEAVDCGIELSGQYAKASREAGITRPFLPKIAFMKRWNDGYGKRRGLDVQSDPWVWLIRCATGEQMRNERNGQ